MRRAVMLVEMIVVMAVGTVTLLALARLFGPLLVEVPKSMAVAAEAMTVQWALDQIHADLDLGGDVSDTNDAVLAVRRPDGLATYRREGDLLVRTWQPTGGTPEEDRQWTLPRARVQWIVWPREGAPVAVEVHTRVEQRLWGKARDKMRSTHLFFAGAGRQQP